MLGQILRSLLSPLDTQYWEQGCLPLPSLLSRFTASLYRTIFKIEAKHNIHQTGTHTHAHRRLPRTAVRQLHSREHQGMHTTSSQQEGQGLRPWSSRCTPPNHRPASCQREGGRDRRGQCQPDSDCGGRGYRRDARRSDQGEAQASRS